jgi:hypothetical protein
VIAAVIFMGDQPPEVTRISRHLALFSRVSVLERAKTAT